MVTSVDVVNGSKKSFIEYLKAWFRILRIPNFLTIPGDLLAGFFFCGGVRWEDLFVAIVATLFAYAYGLIGNDLADFEIDLKERPKRPLPSGQISRKLAIFGLLFSLFIPLLIAVFYPSLRYGILGLLVLITTYNFLFKKIVFMGIFNMALCRVMSLGLGIFAAANWDEKRAVWLIFPIAGQLLYVLGFSQIAKGEMSIKPNIKGRLLVLMGAVMPLAILILLAMEKGMQMGANALLLLIWSSWLLYLAFNSFVVLALPAIVPRYVQRQVGVLIGGLILSQAAWIAAGGAISSPYAVWFSLGVGVLIFPFQWAAKKFSPS